MEVTVRRSEGKRKTGLMPMHRKNPQVILASGLTKPVVLQIAQ